MQIINIVRTVVDETCTCPKSAHRPKLGDRRWYSLKALLEWANNLGRCANFGHM